MGEGFMDDFGCAAANHGERQPLLLLLLWQLKLQLISYLQLPVICTDPKGGGHGCPPVSDRAMDGESETPRSTARASGGFVGEGAFLWLLSLALTKKVTRPQGGSG